MNEYVTGFRKVFRESSFRFGMLCDQLIFGHLVQMKKVSRKMQLTSFRQCHVLNTSCIPSGMALSYLIAPLR